MEQKWVKNIWRLYSIENDEEFSCEAFIAYCELYLDQNNKYKTIKSDKFDLSELQ